MSSFRELTTGTVNQQGRVFLGHLWLTSGFPASRKFAAGAARVSRDFCIPRVMQSGRRAHATAPQTSDRAALIIVVSRPVISEQPRSAQPRKQSAPFGSCQLHFVRPSCSPTGAQNDAQRQQQFRSIGDSYGVQ